VQLIPSNTSLAVIEVQKDAQVACVHFNRCCIFVIISSVEPQPQDPLQWFWGELLSVAVVQVSLHLVVEANAISVSTLQEMPAAFVGLLARWACRVIHRVLHAWEGVEEKLVMWELPWSGGVCIAEPFEGWGHGVPLHIITLLICPMKPVLHTLAVVLGRAGTPHATLQVGRGCVRDVWDPVAGAKSHFGVGVCGCAAEELSKPFQSHNRGFHLLRSQRSDGSQRSAIGCSCAVQAASQHFLHSLHVSRTSAVGALFLGQLGVGAALQFGPVAWGALGSFWRWMLEALQSLFGAAWH
jgi:hypothetical protein